MRVNRATGKPVGKSSRPQNTGIIGNSAAMLKINQQAPIQGIGGSAASAAQRKDNRERAARGAPLNNRARRNLPLQATTTTNSGQGINRLPGGNGQGKNFRSKLRGQ